MMSRLGLDAVHAPTFNESSSDILSFPRLSTAEYGNAFRSHYAATLRFVSSLGASGDLAEEVAQAAWARGWERRGQIRNPGSVGAWVNSIAKNIFLNGRRREQRHECVSDGLTDSAAQSYSPLALMETKRMLSQCRCKDRMVLSKYYLEGYSAEEIAAEIGLTSSAVRVRLLRARQALRAQFTPICRPNRLTYEAYAMPAAS